jgi:hypothetical protein
MKNAILLLVTTLLLTLGAVAQDPIKPLPPPIQFPPSAPPLQEIPPAATPAQAAPVPAQAVPAGVSVTTERAGNVITFFLYNNQSENICVTVTLDEDKSYNTVGSTVGTINVRADRMRVYVASYQRDADGQPWHPVVHWEWTGGSCE